MKTTKLFFIAAILGATFFVSCTPENIEDDITPQQVDRNVRPPRYG